MKSNYCNRILVFGDTHFPYQVEGMFDFLADVKREYKPDCVICVGDGTDMYNASRYPKDPNHPDSFINEVKKVHKCVKKLAKLFPKLTWTMGNHDDRLARAIQSAGLPSELMKTFGEFIKAPKGWEFVDSKLDVTLTVQATKEQITFAHHRGVNTFLIAQRLGRSFVAGHSHSKGNVVAYNNGLKTFFGVNNPCLISNTGSPFSYAKISNINPVRGCTLIENGIPRLVLL